ncbi:MAG: cadherin-like domain-containing protein [Alphaproteobacteria bacterium]|nr:cadherin-like domain-containing protein [Alphaproteobacteria bacterium]
MTTLVAALIDQGHTAAQAEAAIIQAFALPADIDLGHLDPVAATLSADSALAAEGSAVISAAILVQNTVLQVSSVLTGAGQVTDAQAVAAVFDALAETVFANPTPSLTDSNQIRSMTVRAAEVALLTGDAATTVAGVADTVAGVVTASNALITQIAAGGDTGQPLLEALAKVAVVAQGETADRLEQAVAAGDAAALAQVVGAYTGANLLGEVATAEIGDVNGANIGSAGADILQGGDAADVIDGRGGDDRLIGGGGNDLITGGDGSDTAVIAGSAADSTVERLADGRWLVIGADGRDTLTEVEHLEFADRTLHLDGTNNAPTATADIVSVVEDGALSIAAAELLANDGDFDGDALTLSAVGNAEGGTVVLNGDSSVIFTPGSNFDGVARFDYSVADGHGGFATKTVTVDVAAVNDDPTSTPVTLAAGTEDTSIVIAKAALLANAADIDGDVLSATDISADHGAIVDNGDGTVTFTPDANYTGTVTIGYTVADGNGGSVAGSATFNLAATEDEAAISASGGSGQEDGVITGQIAATDVDGAIASMTLVSGTSHGTVTLNGDGSYSFAPDADWNGSDSFVVRTTDTAGGTTDATITVSATAVNDDPTNTPVTLTAGTEDTSIIIAKAALLANASDIDGDVLSATNITTDHGAIVDNGDGTVTFTPEANYTGTVTIGYTVADGQGGSVAGSATLNLAAVNDDPTNTPVTLTAGTEDTSIIIAKADLLANAADIDGDVLSASNISADHGAIVDNGDGTVTFTPEANYTGPVTIGYTVADGQGGSVAGSATLNLAAVNDDPTQTVGTTIVVLLPAANSKS